MILWVYVYVGIRWFSVVASGVQVFNLVDITIWGYAVVLGLWVYKHMGVDDVVFVWGWVKMLWHG